jgi:hypothetical protein
MPDEGGPDGGQGEPGAARGARRIQGEQGADEGARGGAGGARSTRGPTYGHIFSAKNMTKKASGQEEPRAPEHPPTGIIFQLSQERKLAKSVSMRSEFVEFMDRLNGKAGGMAITNNTETHAPNTNLVLQQFGACLEPK